MLGIKNSLFRSSNRTAPETIIKVINGVAALTIINEYFEAAKEHREQKNKVDVIKTSQTTPNEFPRPKNKYPVPIR